MNLLLTGHRGYVGSVLAARLVDRGYRVTGLDAGWFEGSRLSPPLVSVPEWTIDLRDVRQVDLVGFDAVIHLAGLSNDPLGDLDAELTYEINTESALRLARLARNAGVRRFVAASSCSIYGAAGDAWIDEDSTPSPVTPYAESKRMLEEGLFALSGKALEVVIARPGTVFGVSPLLRFDLVLNNLVAWAAATGAVHFKSDGQAWRPLLHVVDLAEALVALVEAPAAEVSGRAFNVGFNDLNLRVVELAADIIRRRPGTRIERAAEAPVDARSYRVNCERLATVWRPSNGPVSLDRGVAELLALLGARPVPVAEFEGGRFQRVAHLRRLMVDGVLDRRLRRTARSHV